MILLLWYLLAYNSDGTLPAGKGQQFTGQPLGRYETYEPCERDRVNFYLFRPHDLAMCIETLDRVQFWDREMERYYYYEKRK